MAIQRCSQARSIQSLWLTGDWFGRLSARKGRQRSVHMMRRVFIAAILFVAVWAPSLLVAAEAGRADLMGKLCGDAASLGDAGRAFVGIAADGSQDERAWATPVARAVIDRKLTCDTKGAVVISSEGSFDALTREQRVAVEGGRSPFLNLKNRACSRLPSRRLRYARRRIPHSVARPCARLSAKPPACLNICLRPPPSKRAMLV